MTRLKPRSSLVPIAKLASIALVVLIAVEVFGLPHLRVSYQYTGPSSDPSILRARYWSVTGPRDANYSEMGDSMTVIALFPVEPSLRTRGLDAMRRLWSQAIDRAE